MISMIEDMSKLTSVPISVLKKIMKKQNIIITNSVEDAIINNDIIASIDLGIGTLYLQLLAEEVKYKFIPSSELEKQVAQTITDKKSPLKDKLTINLVGKLTALYKELL